MSDAYGIWSEAVSAVQDEVVGKPWASCAKTQSSLGREGALGAADTEGPRRDDCIPLCRDVAFLSGERRVLARVCDTVASSNWAQDELGGGGTERGTRCSQHREGSRPGMGVLGS